MSWQEFVTGVSQEMSWQEFVTGVCKSSWQVCVRDRCVTYETCLDKTREWMTREWMIWQRVVSRANYSYLTRVVSCELLRFDTTWHDSCQIWVVSHVDDTTGVKYESCHMSTTRLVLCTSCVTCQRHDPRWIGVVSHSSHILTSLRGCHDKSSWQVCDKSSCHIRAISWQEFVDESLVLSSQYAWVVSRISDKRLNESLV